MAFRYTQEAVSAQQISDDPIVVNMHDNDEAYEQEVIHTVEALIWS